MNYSIIRGSAASLALIAVSALGQANTGQITSTFEPRIIQFGLKVTY